MKEYEETRKGKRVGKILDYLNKGIPCSEIQQRLIASTEKRGENSVKNVEEAINVFSFIEEIKKTNKHSKEDTVNKRDLIVFLSGKNVNTVGIQVKSSDISVSNFYKKFNEDRSKAEKILIGKKLIVINGQLSKDTIKRNFVDQLSEIDKYHKIKTSPSREERPFREGGFSGFSC